MSIARRLLAGSVAAMMTVPVTAASAAAEPVGDGGYRATIRYTEYGIPHIKAGGFGSLGYGYGYAAARDNLCVLADTYLTVRAERSKYHGPDAPGSDLGGASNSLASDLYFRQINDSGVVERLASRPAPHGPRPEVRETMRGYVAGYNRQLAESRAACKGQPWVRPITELDVLRHFYAVLLLGGQGIVMDGIATAQPPVPAAPAAPAAAKAPSDAVARVNAALDNRPGSNAIAIGSAGTANKSGLLLGNPHFPWHGPRRFWQSQLTVPGRLDVAGGSLLGLPFVQIGHNADVAWSHTVSTARPFGLHEVQLKPGEPTTYLVDGKPEAMTSRTVGVEVRRPDGTLDRVRRTLYSTRYGPVVTGVFGVPLPWTAASAHVFADANAGNLRAVNTWFELGRARSTEDVAAVLRSTQGVPWVNTIAADRSGRALYSDIQVVAHVTDELAARCSTPLGGQLFPRTGVSILQGSRSDCAWGTDPDALEPGIFGPSRMPVLTRSDYVINSNDSFWLSNPRQPLTGFPRIFGDTGTVRGPRLRMGVAEIEPRLGGFDRGRMQELLFADRSSVAELAAAATAAMCRTTPGADPAAGAALASWDRRFTTESRGALLFARFWSRVSNPWKVAFNPNDPLRTPHTLNTDDPRIRHALLEAIEDLRKAGISPGAPLGNHQYVERAGARIPVHGGENNLGVLNMLVPVWDPARGHAEVVHGSSFIQVVSFSGRGHCPDASTLLTYSQSGDPASPHLADQTRLFSASQWVRDRFCERDITSSPALRVVHLRG